MDVLEKLEIINSTKLKIKDSVGTESLVFQEYPTDIDEMKAAYEKKVQDAIEDEY